MFSASHAASKVGYSVRRRREFIEALLAPQELRVERSDSVRAALRRTRDGADLADALVTESAVDAGCDAVMTFDQRAMKRAGMRLVERRP